MRRSLKITAWTAGGLLILVLLVVATVLVVANTDSGRALIERMTVRLSDGKVQLSGLSGSFPAALDLDKLQLSDDHGVWLFAERISLRWSPSALLARRVQIDSLNVGRLHIDRAPLTDPHKPKTQISFPHSDLTHANIETLELGPQLAGTAVSLVVHGSAHLRSLKDATADIVGQRTGGVGNYQLQLQFNPARMDATLKLQEPANGPLENVLGVPGLGDLSLLAKLSGPRAAENVELVVDAGALRGRANGTVNLTDTSADLNYTLDASAMEPSAELSWQRVALQGRWHGTLKTPTASGHLEAEQLKLPGGTQLSTLNADLTASGGMLTAHSVVNGLTIPGSQPTLLKAAPLTIDAAMHLSDEARPLDITATHTLFALRAHVITAGKQGAQLNLRLPDLAPLAAFGGVPLRGDANIKAGIDYNSKATSLTADVDAGIDGGSTTWAGALRGRTRLQLSAELTDQSLTINRAQVTGRTLSLSLNGSAARTAAQELNARLELKLSDLAALSPALAGNLALSGKITGPSGAFSASAELATVLSVHGSARDTVSASVNAFGLPKAPRGTIQAHGNLDGAPVHLDVSVQSTGANTVHAVIHHADWKSLHLDGDIVSGSALALAHGRVGLHMTQLGELDRLLGTTLQGSIDGALVLKPVAGRSHTQIQLQAQNVVTGKITTNAQLTAGGPLDALSVHLAAQSPDVGGEPASLTSVSLLNMTADTLRVSSFEGKYHGEAIHLVSPAKLSFADGLSVTALQLKARTAVLDFEGRLAPTLDLRASLRQLQPELINAFVPGLLAAGNIQADAQIKGAFTAPLGHLQVEAIGMRSANDAARGLPAVDVHAGAQLAGNTALLEVKLAAGSASQLTLNGHAPLSPDGALDLRLAGKLDAGLLNPLLEARGKRAAGGFTVDATLTGAATAPEIGGSISLAGGSLHDYAQGINLTDIAAQVEGNHGTLRIVSLTARAAPGTVSVTGSAGVLQRGVPLDLQVTAKNAQPITNSIVTANLDAAIHISGTARERLNIAGTVHINRANVGIPSSLPPNVAVLDVRRRGQTVAPLPEKPLVIDLDVTVQAPRQILVQGRGLDAELAGELHVTGTTDSPLVSGGFDLQRGTFDIASNRLTFSNGSVTFNGAGLKNKLDPSLDFTAQTAVFDATATVRITGFADSPKIELTSTPELPQDEILARLLFGESASQLTALQVVQIGAALATLSGGGGGLNPLAKIQKTLGLDRLSVGGGSNNTGPPGTTTNSGATIEAGRYVSPRVFVAVKESTTGTSQLAVDVDLTKHLKLQTRLGNGTASAQGTTPENDPGSSVGLAYQFEY